MNVKFHPAAAEEFAEAAAFYESALPELGRRFRDEVRDAIALALEHPQAGSVRRASTRHLIVSGFPFDVVYRVRDEVLEVLAVAHHRRRPGYWGDRRRD